MGVSTVLMSTGNFLISSVWRHRWAEKEIVTTMLQWRVSGEHWSRNLSITGATEPDRKQYRILQNISRSSITGSAVRQGWDIFPPWYMKDISMQDNWQHERFGVHYWHPRSSTLHQVLWELTTGSYWVGTIKRVWEWNILIKCSKKCAVVRIKKGLEI